MHGYIYLDFDCKYTLFFLLLQAFRTFSVVLRVVFRNYSVILGVKNRNYSFFGGGHRERGITSEII